MEPKIQCHSKKLPELISDEIKKEFFPKLQKEMDKQFNLLVKRTIV